MKRTKKKIAAKALAILEEGGWTQYRLIRKVGDGHYAHCLIGAIEEASFWPWRLLAQQGLYRDLCRALNLTPRHPFDGGPRGTLWRWNDSRRSSVPVKQLLTNYVNPPVERPTPAAQLTVAPVIVAPQPQPIAAPAIVGEPEPELVKV